MFSKGSQAQDDKHLVSYMQNQVLKFHVVYIFKYLCVQVTKLKKYVGNKRGQQNPCDETAERPAEGATQSSGAVRRGRVRTEYGTPVKRGHGTYRFICNLKRWIKNRN